jgi:hypothetical protein
MKATGTVKKVAQANKDGGTALLELSIRGIIELSRYQAFSCHELTSQKVRAALQLA